MIQRHKVPTIFNIYMLDVICCALGCVVLLWQVAHQQAESTTSDAKKSQVHFERARFDLLSATTDVGALRAEIQQWRDRQGAIGLRLVQAERDRSDAVALATARQNDVDKTRSLLNLSEDQLKKLQAQLEELLASEKKSKAALTGLVKLSADLLARVAFAERRIDTLKGDIALRQAEADAEAKKFRTDLEAVLASERKTKADLAGAQWKNAEVSTRIALAEQRLDSLKGAIALKDAEAETATKKLRAELDALLAADKKTRSDLAGASLANSELTTRLGLSERRIASLNGEIALKQTEIDGALKKQADQSAALRISEENLRKLQKLLDVARDDSKDTKTKLLLTELQLKMRQQDLDKARSELVDLTGARDKLLVDLAASAGSLDDAKAIIARLTKDRDQFKGKVAAGTAQFDALWIEKDQLRKRVVELEAEAEQRFAGIPLTGENVIFLIDTSGSMELKSEDPKDRDPNKWPFLCETLMKLMKSIRTLKHFQVVLFSDKVTYLVGGKGSWLKYEGHETAIAMRNALLKIKVEGGTNMHEAFSEVFAYREHKNDKLDTIYLFSDGLPNDGPPPPMNVNLKDESERNRYYGDQVLRSLKTTWNNPRPGLETVRINAVGFYFPSPDIGAFLWTLARENRGAFAGVR